MVEVSDSARLRARGIEVTLVDGSTHRAILDFEAAHFLEEELGGLDVYLERLNVFQAKGWSGKRMSVVLLGMQACLIHEKDLDEPVDFYRHRIMRSLDMSRVLEYVEALLEALVEAFPQMGAKETDPKVRRSRSSRGKTPTT